jgi:hypothetical protein
VDAAEYYEVSYSTGDDPSAGTRINPVPDNACEITTGLTAGTRYNVWVRAVNDSGSSGWSASVYPQTPGTGFDSRVYGVYFSRYPNGKTYYMDGYQIGSVSGMTSDFPFNKAKYSNTDGFPACFQYVYNSNPGMELLSGYQIQPDDQYIFYNELGRFGWSYLGIVAMIFEEPNGVGQDRTNYGNKTGFVLIEYLKGCEYEGRGTNTYSRYFTIKFTINETGSTSSAKDAYGSFRGCNFFSDTTFNLTLPKLKARLMKDDDANVAYPGIRLGSYSGPNTPDADSAFHPGLMPPDTLDRWAPGATTDEERWEAVRW